MKSKALSQPLKSEELANRRATQIFGLAVTAVFVAILLMNAIFY
jgi:hypothetical protein